MLQTLQIALPLGDGDKVERLLPVHFAYVRLIFHSPFRLHFFLSLKYTTSDYYVQPNLKTIIYSEGA